MYENITLHTNQFYKDAVADKYFEHSSAKRVDTDTVIQKELEYLHPDQQISIIPEFTCNLLDYANAGHAIAYPDTERNATAFGSFKWTNFAPPARRLDGSRGALVEKVLFGKYKYIYNKTEFLLYLVDGRDGSSAYPTVRNQYLVCPGSDSHEATNLIFAAGSYGAQLHNEVWVFNQGFWRKDAALWASVQHSNWSDVILAPEMKKAIVDDVIRFFNSRTTYQRLKVPWKRGIIYHGPPGNGKTISIKAMMHTLYSRPEPIPTLYVKTLTNFNGPEYALGQIFGKARAEAPCFLVFEDLDSIVSDGVRSFFLNEVDGLSANDGIMMVGSTNHLDRLDPGISKRPSRFDRKYYFPDPSFDERVAYAEFWRKKLSEDGDVEFPKKMCKGVAEITDGFSFAYIQEAFVAALLVIAGKSEKEVAEDRAVDLEISILMDKCMGEYFVEHGGGRDRRDDGDDLERYVLWRELKKQVKLLRDELGDGKGDDAS